MVLEYLELGFENCETARISGKYIGRFYAGDLKTTYERIACNAISKIDRCHEFAVEIHKNADKRTYPDMFCHDDEERKLFERIQAYPDITSIQFCIDGEESRFWTDCDEESPAPPQKSYVSKPGHMYLVVGNKVGMSDFFDKEEIDDADIVDSYFQMSDTGDANQRDYDILDDEA